MVTEFVRHRENDHFKSYERNIACRTGQEFLTFLLQVIILSKCLLSIDLPTSRRGKHCRHHKRCSISSPALLRKVD